jgi:signal transduction histidine kinase
MKANALLDILRKYGTEEALPAGTVLVHQGAPSDGVYYLVTGRLGVFREEADTRYRLSDVEPGELAGEVGVTTGWRRTATVQVEEDARVIHVAEADFRRALTEAPLLIEIVARQMGERLTDADEARIALGQSYQQATERVRRLSSEKEQLEELLRLREELANMIVHDLRNPLSVLVGGVAMLEKTLEAEPGSERLRPVIEIMNRSSDRMQRLVDTLLDIARLEQGELRLDLRPTDVRGLVEDLVTEEKGLAEAQGLTLRSQLPEEPLQALADRDIIQRTLINLVDNAIKFTPKKGEVRIEVEDEGDRVKVMVIDTGPGIPAEERDRIFEKFTQVKGHTSNRRGTGLGLTFCHMAVDAHHGEIFVEDGPEGRGSCFVFTLPKATDQWLR